LSIQCGEVYRSSDYMVYPEGYVCDNFLSENDTVALKIKDMEKIMPKIFRRLVSKKFKVELHRGLMRTFILVAEVPTEKDKQEFEEKVKKEFLDYPLTLKD